MMRSQRYLDQTFQLPPFHLKVAPIFLVVIIHFVTQICIAQYDLITAAKNNDLIAVEALINEKVDINLQNHQMRTALMYAASNGYISIVRLLLVWSRS